MAEFIESLELRPLDVGGLNMAHWLEGTGLVMMGLARHGVGNFDFALGATVHRLSRSAAGPSSERTGRRAPWQWLMDHRKDSHMPDVNVGGRWSAGRGFSR